MTRKYVWVPNILLVRSAPWTAIHLPEIFSIESAVDTYQQIFFLLKNLSIVSLFIIIILLFICSGRFSAIRYTNNTNFCFNASYIFLMSLFTDSIGLFFHSPTIYDFVTVLAVRYSWFVFSIATKVQNISALNILFSPWMRPKINSIQERNENENFKFYPTFWRYVMQMLI